MGGKQKQSQRTKNNVKPSSSGRSAELLNGSIKLDSGAALSAGGKVFPKIFPTLAAVNLEQGLNPEIAVCVKKLNKKDPITKIKALQELSELVKRVPAEDVLATLPSWTHFYKILSVDVDRKVRELTQVCHGAVLGVCGRGAAPWLRALTPAWLQARYDDHAPAAAAAARANPFPAHKLPELLSFCKSEIMSQLADNLTADLHQRLANKIEDAADREMQVCRIVTSALQGLQYFVEHLPGELDDWLRGELDAVLGNKAFWKLPSTNHVQVKVSWFDGMSAVARRLGAARPQPGGEPAWPGRLARAALARPAPGAARAATHCLLTVMNYVPNWDKYLENEGVLSKRILEILQSGAGGDARPLLALLLPLLASLPAALVSRDFYLAFFTAAFEGLEKKSILSSKSERQAWIASTAECVRFVSTLETEFSLDVSSAAHRRWTEAALSDTREPSLRNALIKYSANDMAALIKFWLKQSTQKFDQLARNFWQNITSTVLAQIERCPLELNQAAALIEGHAVLLRTLRSSFVQQIQKQSIKFCDEPPTPAEDPPPAPAPPAPAPPAAPADPVVTQRFEHSLHELVVNVCVQYFEAARTKHLSRAISPVLSNLLRDFDGDKLWTDIARQSGYESVLAWYEGELQSWLSGDTLRCAAVVDVVMSVAGHMSDEDQERLYHSFQLFPPTVIEWVLAALLSPSRSLRSAGARWLRGGVAAQAVVRLAARAADAGDAGGAGDEGSLSLLEDCLRHQIDGELSISWSSVDSIVRVTSAALRGGGGGGVARALCRAGRGAPVMEQLYTELAWSSSPERELAGVWRGGCAALTSEQRRRLLQRAAEHLYTTLLTTDEVINEKIEDVTSLYCDILPLAKNPSSESIEEMLALIKIIIKLPEKYDFTIQYYATRYDCIVGNLNCPFDDDSDVIKKVIEDCNISDAEELQMPDLVSFANKVLFRVIMLRKILTSEREDAGDEEEEGDETWSDVLLNEKYFKEQLCEIMHDYAVMLPLNEGYDFHPNFDLIQKITDHLNTNIEAIISCLSKSRIIEVSSNLSERSASHGYYWSYAYKEFVSKSQQEMPQEKVEKELDATKLEEILTGNGYFHTMQANSKPCPESAPALSCKYEVMLRSLLAAFPAGDVVDDRLLGEAGRCQPRCDIDVVVNTYYRHRSTMLYEIDISPSPWAVVVYNAAVCHVLAHLVAARGRGDPAGDSGDPARDPAWPTHHWDFLAITLCSLLESLYKSREHIATTKVSMLSHAVLSLYTHTQRYLLTLHTTSSARAEWDDVFAPSVNLHLYNLLLYLVERREPQFSAPLGASCRALVAGGAHWRVVAGGAAALAAAAGAALRDVTPPHRQLLAHRLLHAAAAEFAAHDERMLSRFSEECGGGEEPADADMTLSVQLLAPALLAALDHLEDVLQDTDSEWSPDGGACAAALGALLLGEAALSLCAAARGDAHIHLLHALREMEVAGRILSASMWLLPRELRAWAGAAPDAHDPHDAHDALDAPPAHYVDMFQLPLQHDVECVPLDVGREVARVSCRALALAVSVCGGAAAAWRSAAAAGSARALRALVVLAVTPALVRRQLDAAARLRVPDTEVRVHIPSRSAECTVLVEERPMTLTVRLARDHPLSLPTAAADCALAPPPRWLPVYLAHQNGSLARALRLWSEGVQTKVNNAAACYICYSRVAGGKLPAVRCHQCNNCFHTGCLRKWFATSSKSTCPLCRSSF